MNSSEKRRKELLDNARAIYHDQKTPPAVHPRFRSSYDKLYGESGSDELSVTGTFGLRLFICALLFALFVAIDFKGTEVMNVDSKRIADEITYQFDVQKVWKEL